jgi:hypothetical protein
MGHTTRSLAGLAARSNGAMRVLLGLMALAWQSRRARRR